MAYVTKMKGKHLLFLFSLITLINLTTPCLAKGSLVDSYKLGATDIIKVTVIAGGEKQIEAELAVSEQGTVNVPLIGNIPAAGLTLDELEKKLLSPLEQDYFVSPQVQVIVVEYHSLKYRIAGAINEPGLYELNFTPTILDLIVKAGGVVEGRGNIAYILRDSSLSDLQNTLQSEIASKEPLKIDLIKLLDQGDMSENVKLTSGDTVYIPLNKALNQANSKIYVQGQVKQPGVFDYQPGATVLSACIMAGGFAQFAAPARTKIVRNEGGSPISIKVNLEKIIKGETPDIPVKPGDRIHVPESWF